MGHRALIGKTQKNGTIKLFYSHWGALEAYDAGKRKPKVPEELEELKHAIVKNKKEFGKEVDYLHHEAVWLDGVCYCPLWIFPSDSVKVDKWKTEGQGILLLAKTGEEFNSHRDKAESTYLIDDLTDLSASKKIKLMINYIVGQTADGDIPDFSPLGFGWKYKGMRELLKELK